MIDVIEILTKYFIKTPLLAIEALIAGYLFLFIFFFDLNKREWKYKFSDLDKVILTVAFGLYFFVIVMALSLPIYKVLRIFLFRGEELILRPSIIEIDVNVGYLIFGVIIMILVSFLYEKIIKVNQFDVKNKLKEFIQHICVIGTIIILTTFIAMLIIIGNTYQEITKSLAIIILINILYFYGLLLLLVVPAYGDFSIISESINIIKNQFHRNKNLFYIIIIILIFLPIFGSIAIKPSIKTDGKSVRFIYIERALFSDGYENIRSAVKSVKKVEQTFQIHPKFLKWVPILVDFNITRCYIQGSKKVTVNCSGNRAIVNYSSSEAFNLTIYGEEYFNYSKLKYKYEKFSYGDNLTVNITIFNNQPYDVHFSEATIHINELRRSYRFVSHYPKPSEQTHPEMIFVKLEPKDIDDGQLIHAYNIHITANKTDTFSIFLGKIK
jgi:hypothetical protein